jgi:hypothetical protein
MRKEPRLKHVECNAEDGLKLALKLDNCSRHRRVWEAAVPAALKGTDAYRPNAMYSQSRHIYLPQTNVLPGQRVYDMCETGT